ncbi:NAD(P)-binding domain-containing protein [Sporomusa carbonis]|uniref:NAD(P)-binding domain-containing protein n=1 Tax=Sporomusa carbonis TaxID=3076075 RepID=UPI003C7E8468
MNIADKGFSIAVYNRTVAKVTKFVNQQAAGLPVGGARSMAEFTAMLKRPRAGDFSFRLVLSRFLMFDQG